MLISLGRPGGIRPHVLLYVGYTKSSDIHRPLPNTRLIGKIYSHSQHRLPSAIRSSQVEARGNFVAAGRSAGNENRRWHGTTRGCLLGDNGNCNLCSSQSCSLCGIIRTSYSLSLFGKKTGWGRQVPFTSLLAFVVMNWNIGSVREFIRRPPHQNPMITPTT